MKVPFLDLDRAVEPIRGELEEAVLGVMRSGRFVLGPEVASFEEEFGAYLEGCHVIGVSSGTAALFVALMALEIGPGDEVITTPFSFASPVEAICRLGATPVFVDIDRETFNLNVHAVAEAITDRTRAVLPVHLFGKCVELEGLREICEARGVALVEDAAQAHGARAGTGSAGSLAGALAGTVGDFGCFSFYPTKNLGAAGDAGAVVTRSPKLAERARMVARHGSRRKYRHEILGQNERLDAIQAAVLRVKLPWLDRWNAERRAIAARYREELGDIVAFPRDDGGEVYHHVVVRVDERDEVMRRLAQAGVGTGIYYPEPLHTQPAFEGRFRGTPLPESERAARQALALPVFPGLCEAELRHVIESVRAVCR